MNKPDKYHLRIGMLPLLDATPLVVAKSLGFFDAEHLDVELKLSYSWAQIRDALQLEELDAAHALPLMPIAATLGLDGLKTETLSGISLNTNGNAISLATPLVDKILSLTDKHSQPNDKAAAFAQLINQRKSKGLPPLRLAHVHPYSSHHYLLRAWLASGGINPDEDVELRVLPPSYMATQMATGNIDGFCVGAPWNRAANDMGLSQIYFNTADFWPDAQDKVLAVRKVWALEHPDIHASMIKALIKAGEWLDESLEHRRIASHLLVEGDYLTLPEKMIEEELTGTRQSDCGTKPNITFSDNLTQLPCKNAALWYASQLYRWGHYSDEEKLRQAVNDCIKPEFYLNALSEINGEAAEQASNTYTQGREAKTLQINGQAFDPDAPFRREKQ